MAVLLAFSFSAIHAGTSSTSSTNSTKNGSKTQTTTTKSKVPAKAPAKGTAKVAAAKAPVVKQWIKDDSGHPITKVTKEICVSQCSEKACIKTIDRALECVTWCGSIAPISIEAGLAAAYDKDCKDYAKLTSKKADPKCELLAKGQANILDDIYDHKATKGSKEAKIWGVMNLNKKKEVKKAPVKKVAPPVEEEAAPAEEEEAPAPNSDEDAPAPVKHAHVKKQVPAKQVAPVEDEAPVAPDASTDDDGNSDQ